MARLHLDILRLCTFAAVLLLVNADRVSAQISPGPLSGGHQGLEGVNNCTSCHERGSEISSSKCLNCHTEIGSLISFKHGMHARTSSQPCNECHKEHLGRDVRITRFTPTDFSHKETGFDLNGAHARLKCAGCHDQQQFRVEKSALPKESTRRTYLGLRAACVSCHEDRHENTAGPNCQTCHTTAVWAPIRSFDHAATHFPLTGKHVSVSCAKCHITLAKVPRPKTISFAVASFSDCASCHHSPHKPEFTLNRGCTDCHNTEGWTSTKGFNHSVTRFPLIGKHMTVACEKCHAGMKKQKQGSPIDFSTKPFNDCRSCHKSPHDAKVNTSACNSCHVPADWHSVTAAGFDHSQTGFPLRGMHATVSCDKCHGLSRAANLAVQYRTSRRCATCHEDYHQGAFDKRYTDCTDCHSERGFSPSTFTLEKHNMLRFPLAGSHAAVLCKECHTKSNKSTRFVFENLSCISCHTDHHKGAFNKLMGTVGCGTCHNPLSWNTVAFDHKNTGFPLDGHHASLSCAQCHKLKNGADRYSGTPKQCASCHQEPHVGQFERKGATLCETCHTAKSWRVLIFNHETQSSFHLNGAHARVPCGACHRTEKTASASFVRFKPLPQTCESCHQGKR